MFRHAAIAAACAAALAIGSAAQAQPTMTLMAHAGIFRDNDTATVVKPFGPVQYAEGGTSAQMLGTLRAQRADPQVDIVIMDVTTAAVFSELDPRARQAAGGCGPAVTYDHPVLVHDMQALPTPPEGFAAMSDARFVANALSGPMQAAFTERMFYGPTNAQ